MPFVRYGRRPVVRHNPLATRRDVLAIWARGIKDKDPFTSMKIVPGSEIYRDLVDECKKNGIDCHICKPFKWFQMNNEDVITYKAEQYHNCGVCRSVKKAFIVHVYDDTTSDLACTYCDRPMLIRYLCINCRTKY